MKRDKKEFNIGIELDENNMPKNITWKTTGDDKIHESKAMLISLFDKETLETLKIDLWVRDFQMAEMDRLIFHTLNSLSDTYFNATKNQELASQMKSFARHFGMVTEIIPAEEN